MHAHLRDERDLWILGFIKEQNDQGVYPSRGEIAESLRLTRYQVNAPITRLIERSLIEHNVAKKRSSRISLFILTVKGESTLEMQSPTHSSLMRVLALIAACDGTVAKRDLQCFPNYAAHVNILCEAGFVELCNSGVRCQATARGRVYAELHRDLHAALHN